MHRFTKQRVWIAVILIFLCIPFTAIAQHQPVSDDSLQLYVLPELSVEATRIDQPLNYQPTQIDVIGEDHLQLLTGLTMGQVLGMEGALFVKSYGPGGIATISQRGLSAGQSQVLWEGIPINGVVLGLTNFALLPSSFFSSIEISSGTPSTAFGGGGLAGAIYLNTDYRRKKSISITQGVGSFGSYRTALRGGYYQGHWSFGVKAQYNYAKNDFTYYNIAFDKKEHRIHNSTEQLHVMAHAAYNNDGRHFKTRLWILDSYNKIPGKITKRNSKAWQDDKFVRWLSTYRTEWNDVEITVKNYLDQVELNYFDPEIDTESYTQTRRWLVSTAFEKDIADWLNLKGEISGSIAGVESSNYGNHKVRRKLSVLFNPVLFLLNDRLRVYPALRVDAYNDFGTAVSPSLGLNYELIKQHLFLRGQVSQNFNPPTFNDLYWPKVGDPTLQPEQSLNMEIGAVAQFDSPIVRRIELSVYQINVEQGIRWLPNSKGRSAPANIDNMRTRGFNLSTQSRWMLAPNLRLSWKQTVVRNRTEITKPRFPGDAAMGHQMRYVPEWKYQTSLMLKRNWLSAIVYYRWTGRRYITAVEDVDHSLDPYSVADIMLQGQKTLQDLKLTATVGLKNVLDADYQIVKWYPMPGINVHFNLTITYNF